MLRDGVGKGWVKVNELQDRITDYCQWANQTYQTGLGSRQQNPNFNYVNEFVQQMQLTVLRFAETWPYFDPTKYTPPVKVVFSGQTYFSITGTLNMDGGIYPALPAVPDAAISNVDVFWMQDFCDAYNLVQGVQVGYGATTEPYSGILISNAPPPAGRPCNSESDDFCYFKQSVAVAPGNPIVAVTGTYTTGGGTFSVSFTFKDGSSTGPIPSQNQESYPATYNIAPPPCYYLASIWTPSTEGYYYSAFDIIFGFRYAPESVG